MVNKIIIWTSLLFIVCLVVTTTSIKVINNHNDKLLLVDKKYAIENAKKCINEKKCSKGNITLKELEEKGYIEKMVNHVTKEYYNEESYVIINDLKEEFVIR